MSRALTVLLIDQFYQGAAVGVKGLIWGGKVWGGEVSALGGPSSLTPLSGTPHVWSPSPAPPILQPFSPFQGNQIWGGKIVETVWECP